MRFARPSVSWFLLALFALVSCAGQGLHLLPGAGACSHGRCGHAFHAHGSHRAALCEGRHRELGRFSLSLRQARELAEAHANEAADGAEQLRIAASSNSTVADCGDFCMVCAFFAQGQLLTLSYAPILIGNVCLLRPIDSQQPSVAAIPRAHSPRAPPAAC